MGCRHTTTASYPLEIENHFSIRNEIATSVEIISYQLDCLTIASEIIGNLLVLTFKLGNNIVFPHYWLTSTVINRYDIISTLVAISFRIEK